MVVKLYLTKLQTYGLTTNALVDRVVEYPLYDGQTQKVIDRGE